MGLDTVPAGPLERIGLTLILESSGIKLNKWAVVVVSESLIFLKNRVALCFHLLFVESLED